MSEFDGFFEYTTKENTRCDGCEYRKVVYANGGWSFYGCYHTPYHGKQVSQIKDCPGENERMLL